MRLWDAVLGRPILSLTGWSISEFTRDGRIVAACDDKISAFRVDPALECRTLDRVSVEPREYHRPSIRGDGRVLAVGTSQGALLWDLAQAREIAYLPIGKAWHLTFEPSGDLLTSGSRGVWRWPLRLGSGGGKSLIGPPRRLALSAKLNGIDQDRSGRIIAKADHDSVTVLSPERKVRLEGLDDCRTVAVSPDGQWLATGSHHRGAGLAAGRCRPDDRPRDRLQVRRVLQPRCEVADDVRLTVPPVDRRHLERGEADRWGGALLLTGRPDRGRRRTKPGDPPCRRLFQAARSPGSRGRTRVGRSWPPSAPTGHAS